MFYHASDNVGIIIFTTQHLSYSMSGLMDWFSIFDLLIEKSHQYI